MLYTNTLYTGKEIWNEVQNSPQSLLEEEICRRYCTKILDGLYVPNFNLDDEYWLFSYYGDWRFSSIQIDKDKLKLMRKTKFHGGTPELIIRR